VKQNPAGQLRLLWLDGFRLADCARLVAALVEVVNSITY
jgi:hypothetical protein